MREQILKLLKAVPFTLFVVDVVEDVQYSIGTNDHATAFKRVLAIEDDRGYVHLIPYAHIRRLHHQAATPLYGSRLCWPLIAVTKMRV
jgi:hypothetical protein